MGGGGQLLPQNSKGELKNFGGARMTEIRNTRELRNAYEWLYMIGQVQDKDRAAREGSALEQLARELKSQVRGYNKKVSDRRLVGGDYDRAVYLIECPDWVIDRATAERWFSGQERVDIQPSQYDCTGRWFTSWHKVFERHGKWMCYHCMCADV